MDFIKVDDTNIEKEHICCCITNKKGENCVSSKKEWMQGCLKDGLVFLKADVRGKVFIEYMPAENAWYPIDAPGYMHINCFWISGQYKGKGYANQLLEQCIEDAKKKGKCGFRKKLKYRFHSVKGGNHTVFFGDCFKFFVRNAASV